jgi:squalene-hopene/tetraprenyl-beta-curcumene cyclase
MRRFVVILAAVAPLAFAPCAQAIDDAHQQKARAVAQKAVGYLRSKQDEKSGGWAVNPQGPAYPAITGLVVNGMLLQPGIDERDPAVRAGVGYILKYRQPDGGLYDTILPSYNTSICLSALCKVNTPEAKAAIRPAQDFLRSLQFGEGAATTGPASKEAQKVDTSHPFYGGVGYGRSQRPDLSNTAFFLEAMHDSGVPGDDPAFQRALVFLRRVQMDERINDMPYAKGSRQGGFIYSTSESKEKLGTGQTEVNASGGMIEETLDDGTKVSRLRAYGSMTYSGFKSLIYAQLAKDDPRVKSALFWIQQNYTLKENPGIGADGEYYYFLTFARAMEAWGQPTLTVIPSGGRPTDGEGTKVSPPGTRDWANDLIDRLAELQNEDGSFKVQGERWMESNPVLITAYGLLALGHAAK